MATAKLIAVYTASALAAKRRRAISTPMALASRTILATITATCLVIGACHSPSLREHAPESSSAASRPPPAKWGSRPVAASAGCGQRKGTAGDRSVDIAGVARLFTVMLPTGYDGTQPYPLMFGFHGSTRTHLDCRDRDCRGLQSVFGERAVIVYMKSLSAGWRDDAAEFSNNVPFFDVVLATLKSEHCIDENRIVVTGTSSGAVFSNHLACARSDQLLAVVSVGGKLPEQAACQRPVAALVIHGVDDWHIPFALGEAARDQYRGRNGCAQQAPAATADAHAAVRAERAAGKATFRCVSDPSCRPGLPVAWCEHGEGGWDNSTHAWPTFGGQMIDEFLNAL